MNEIQSFIRCVQLSLPTLEVLSFAAWVITVLSVSVSRSLISLENPGNCFLLARKLIREMFYRRKIKIIIINARLCWRIHEPLFACFRGNAVVDSAAGCTISVYDNCLIIRQL